MVALISTLIWLPLGVWIGLRRRITNIILPFAQFLAAFLPCIISSRCCFDP